MSGCTGTSLQVLRVPVHPVPPGAGCRELLLARAEKNTPDLLAPSPIQEESYPGLQEEGSQDEVDMLPHGVGYCVTKQDRCKTAMPQLLPGGSEAAS